MAVVQSIQLQYLIRILSAYSHIYYYRYLSPTHSFIPGLKPSFSANHSKRSLSFSSTGFTTGIPQTVYLLLSIFRLLLFSFFSFLHFLIVVSVRQVKMTHVGFRAHVKIAYRIVSELRWPKSCRQSTWLKNSNGLFCGSEADLRLIHCRAVGLTPLCRR